MSSCSLCSSIELLDYHQDKRRKYQQCATCQLVIVPREYYLSAEDEKAEYDLHDNNNPLDVGYQQFLSRALDPVLARVLPSAEGLDFGCGEGKALSFMAETRGILVHNYDLYYSNQPDLLLRQYDFITLTEVIEHIADAASLLLQLDTLLKPGGILVVMTKRVHSLDAFKQWHYKNDPTHINFYSDTTFAWIANKFDWQLEIVGKDVIFFLKPGRCEAIRYVS